MGRWIDADAMLEYLELMYDEQHDWRNSYTSGVLGAIYYIKHKAPSIDIVRCKECKYVGGEKCQMRNNIACRFPKADDYCSYGERRDDD